MKFTKEFFSNKRVLLLQGPVGPFFHRLKLDLEAQGSTVYKVNFNGGDWAFYPTQSINYRGHLDDMDAFFERIYYELDIQMIVLLGDCRSQHIIAQTVAKRHAIEVAVFEEGYIRPNFITLEHGGVNAYSIIPKTAEFYRAYIPSPVDKEITIGKSFNHAAVWAMAYYLACFFLHPFFHQYQHHRSLHLFEGLTWWRALGKKIYYKYTQRKLLGLLTGEMSNQYYLLPLQLNIDSQLHTHSRFDSIPEFITYVMQSFAQHAPSDTSLVIKHHPLDRGYHDYTKCIKKLAAKLGVDKCVIYLHDQHLPSLLEHSRGVVLINSTVGMSALDHEKPLKACGEAIYNMEGLTYQGDLDDFWKDAENLKVDEELFERFKNYIVHQTQINGNFYKPVDAFKTHTGINLFRE
ncbi:MAG: capsular biosynthesis protein [Methylophilus sp.]|jgi:capsular polysaccharide export protein